MSRTSKLSSYFSTAYFDEPRADVFETMALKEGLVSTDNVRLGGSSEDLDDERLRSLTRATRLKEEETILDAIMIFDKVDANYAVFRWDKLINLGIVAASPKAHRGFKEDILSNADLRKDNDIFQRCLSSTAIVFQSNSNQIIKNSSMFSLRSLKQFGGLPADKKKFNEIARSTFPQILKELVDSPDLEAVKTERRYRKDLAYSLLVFEPYVNEIQSLFLSYAAGLYFATLENGCFSSSILPRGEPSTARLVRKKSALEMMQTLRFDFGKQVVLPQPATIEEAVELKNTPQVKRLRQILNEWCYCLEEGNEPAEAKIRRDIEVANKDMLRIKGLKELRKTPYFITLNAIGAQIPVFSHVLSILNAGLDLYQSYVDRRISWLGRG
jgi:hypothetical protein